MRILMTMVLVLGAACSKDKGKQAGSDCEAAVARGVDATIAKRRAGNTQPLTPQEAAVPEQLKVALAKTCVADKWSKEVIDCFKTADDVATCKQMLTPEQRGAYGRAAMGVMTGAAGGGMGGPHGGMGGPHGGMGGPAHGSAMHGGGAGGPTMHGGGSGGAGGSGAPGGSGGEGSSGGSAD